MIRPLLSALERHAFSMGKHDEWIDELERSLAVARIERAAEHTRQRQSPDYGALVPDSVKRYANGGVP